MVKTMAVKITKKTYPIAVAALPARFALFSLENVLGNYLVINGLSERRVHKGKCLLLVVGNSWMNKEHLLENYDFVGKEQKNKFTEICPN